MTEDPTTGPKLLSNRLYWDGVKEKARPDEGPVVVLLSLVALSLLPFWPYRFGDLNIFWPEIIVFVIGVYLFYHYPYSLYVSKTSSLAVLLFLFSGSISLIFTPRPIQGLSQYLQYCFIFLLFVPVTISIFFRYRNRWKAYLCFNGVLSLISIVGAFHYIAGAHPESIRLFYGNHNGYYWIVSSAFLLNVGWAFSSSEHFLIRSISGFIAFITAMLLIVSISLSALLQAGAGLFVFISWYLVFRNQWVSKTQWTVAISCISLASIIFIIIKWEAIYFYGTLSARIPMYTEAIAVGVEKFPFGAGMGSSPIAMDDLPERITRSIHNAVLHFWVEVGIVGTAAFTMIIVDWIRSVVVQICKHPNRWESFEVAIVSVFFGYIPVMLFQPHPVRRYWWAFFALGWAAVRGKQEFNSRRTQ